MGDWTSPTIPRHGRRRDRPDGDLDGIPGLVRVEVSEPTATGWFIVARNDSATEAAGIAAYVRCLDITP